MRSHSFRHAYLLAAWMAASAAFAGPDIVKCTDAAGHVTLTDEPCREGSQTLLVPGNATPASADGEHPLAVTHIVTSERVIAPPSAPRAATLVKKAGPERMLARDVLTLKAARAAMLLDNSARHAHLAGLN
ncbi:MAG TPA: DUF4124 domain-containing protein [Telluria sp.]|nr:DUF4124 domain-containing protein [Telluria sp.]